MSETTAKAAGESTFRPVFFLMCGRAAGQAAAFLIPVVLTRLYDPATFGNYKRIFLLYGSLYGIAQLGFAESLYYFLPRFPGSAGKLAVNAGLALAGSGLLCGALLVFGRTPAARWLGDPALAGELPLAALFLALMLVSSMLEIALVSRKRYALASLSYLANDLVRAGCLLLPAFALRSLRALLVGAVIFALVRLAASLGWMRRLIPGSFRPDRALFRAQCGYALPFALAVLVDTACASLHQYVVSFQYDAATFALYSIALLQIPLVDYTATAASSVVMVRMGEALREGHTDTTRALWHDAVAKLALIFFPLVAWVLVIGRQLIVVLFTARYLAAVPLFKLASLSVLLLVLQTDTVLRVLAETRFLLVLNLGRLAATALLIEAALSRFQLAGAIGLVLATSLAARAVSLARIGRALHLGLRELLPWRRLSLTAAAATLAGLAAWAVHARLPWPPVPHALASSAILAVLFAALAIQARLFPLSALTPALDWLRRARPAPGVSAPRN